MKKIIGIYCGSLSGYDWDEGKILENGGGGSETWAVEISREFQSRGFHVIVFNETKQWHFAPSGVEYVPFQLFKKRCEYQYFDYFISSRQISEIGKDLICPNVYIMSHDICMHYANSLKDLKLDRVKKIGYLSEWHKKALQSWYPSLPNEQLFKTINGVDASYYEDSLLEEKQNEMVWSSRQERGLLFFIEKIFPRIREKVTDFILNVCLYESELDIHIDGINFLGKLGKRELCHFQKKSKIWIYPNMGYLTKGNPFQETFCITAVENGLSKNAIICGKNGGLIDTLAGYSGLIGETFIKNGIVPYELADKYAEFIAEEAIKILTNDEYRIRKAKEACDICKNYTWASAVDTWINEWGLNFKKNR